MYILLSSCIVISVNRIITNIKSCSGKLLAHYQIYNKPVQKTIKKLVKNYLSYMNYVPVCSLKNTLLLLSFPYTQLVFYIFSTLIYNTHRHVGNVNAIARQDYSHCHLSCTVKWNRISCWICQCSSCYKFSQQIILAKAIKISTNIVEIFISLLYKI